MKKKKTTDRKLQSVCDELAIGRHDTMTLGDSTIQTYAVSKCNLKSLVKNVYPVSKAYSFCPLCGESSLLPGYSYAIQINDTECVKLSGSACFDCDSFFTIRNELTEWLKSHYYNNDITVLHDVLSCAVPRRYRKPNESNERIQKKIQKEKDLELLYSSIPTFSTQTALYVYKGNIACNSYHNTHEVKVKIPFLGAELAFYAVYCFECNKFLMKYADYETYLKRFKLFPAKIKLLHRGYVGGDKAKESPLMLNGYSVSSNAGLSQLERQKLLAFIIDYGILSKRKVLDYLEMFIAESYYNPSRQIAVSKWKDDKKFVLEHSEGAPIVVVGEVLPLKK